jgi:uncharacterized protein
MCGPLVILVGARYPKQDLSSTTYHLIYHSGRILVYTILGILSGLLGGVLGKLAVAARIPGVVSLIVGMIVIILGLGYLGWLPYWNRSIQSNSWWQRTIKAVMQTPGKKGTLALGMLNGILPCGLVYESLFVAGASGSVLIGGLGMFLFGLATIPALVIFGVAAQMLSSRVRKWFVWAGGIFMIIVGVLLILRGMNGLGIGPAHGNMGKMP